MKLEIERYRILIIPDRNDGRDAAYIEEVLGLKRDGDTIFCRRVNVINSQVIVYLEIIRDELDVAIAHNEKKGQLYRRRE